MTTTILAKPIDYYVSIKSTQSQESA